MTRFKCINYEFRRFSFRRQRLKVENMLKNLTPEREKIAETMIYCVEHADAAEEIVDLICDSIWSIDSTVPRKVVFSFLPTKRFQQFNFLFLDC